MLSKIKLLLGITDTSKDDLLQVLIDQVTDQVIFITHNPKCVRILENTVIQMVIFNYNRLGTEGLSSESYSGVNFNYLNDYPENILKILRTHRKVRTIHD